MNRAALDLRGYLAVVWQRKWTIAVVAVTSTAAALFFSYRQTPKYTSSAEVVVRPARFDPKLPSAAFGFLNMETEGRIANSLPVATLARQHLADKRIEPAPVSASHTTQAETITFTSTSPSPASAQASAQAYAEAYLEYRRNDVLGDLEAARQPLDQQISDIREQLTETKAAALRAEDPARREVLNAQYTSLLSQQSMLIQKRNELASGANLNVGDLLQTAAFPSSPSSPDHKRAGILGIVVGLVLGVSLSFLRERLDQGVNGRDELELHSGAPVLALIPRVSSRNGMLIMLDRPVSAGAEAFKSLRVRLLHAAAQRGFKNIVVTSSVAGEGKTSTTANLGVALAQSGKEVVLISADLRRPRMHEYFPPTNGVGLTAVLLGRERAPEALSRTGIQNLWVLHAGEPWDSSGQSDMFASDSMKEVLEELSSLADFVLIDSPPLLGVSDATALASLADGVLFVTDPRRVEMPVLEQARMELELVGAPVIGVVVNNYDPRLFRPYSSRYRYTSYGPDPGSTAPATVSCALVKRDGSLALGELPSEPQVGRH
jgi:polysaccharide biosynthesis transport protein